MSLGYTANKRLHGKNVTYVLAPRQKKSYLRRTEEKASREEGGERSESGSQAAAVATETGATVDGGRTSNQKATTCPP